MKARATGHCGCGSIRYRVDGPLDDVVNCHCDRCRRTSGHFVAATRAEVDDVTIEDDTTLRWWDPSPEVQYGFCVRCGGSVFWRSADRPGIISIMAGTIDQPSHLRTRSAIFTADAGDYHRLDATLENLPYDRGG